MRAEVFKLIVIEVISGREQLYCGNRVCLTIFVKFFQATAYDFWWR